MRKLNFVRSAAVLLTGILISVSAGAQQSARDYQGQIEDLNKEMVQAMLSGDTEKTLDMYAEDAISLPSYEPLLQGKSQIKESIEKMKQSGAKITSFAPVIVKVIPEGNLVTEIGTYTMTVSVPGDQVISDKGKYLTIWEKQGDGSLKIKVETWNSDQNMMEQAAGMGQGQKEPQL